MCACECALARGGSGPSGGSGVAGLGGSPGQARLVCVWACVREDPSQTSWRQCLEILAIFARPSANCPDGPRAVAHRVCLVLTEHKALALVRGLDGARVRGLGLRGASRAATRPDEVGPQDRAATNSARMHASLCAPRPALPSSNLRARSTSVSDSRGSARSSKTSLFTATLARARRPSSPPRASELSVAGPPARGGSGVRA